MRLKRLWVGVATLVLTLGMFSVALVPVHGSASDLQKVSLKSGGKMLSTPGMLLNGTMVVDVKKLASEMGLGFEERAWSSEFTVYRGSNRVGFTIGSIRALVNGHELVISVAPTRAGDSGSYLVPLRFLMENLGFAVRWHGGSSPSERYTDLAPIEENHTVVTTIRERSETKTLSIDIQYPQISGEGLAPEIQNKINAFLRERVESGRKEATKAQQELLSLAPNGVYPYRVELSENYSVTYNQKGLLSIYFDDYIYLGGPHGTTIRSSHTFDLRTGDEMKLADLFKEGTDYVSLINERVGAYFSTLDYLLAPFKTIRPDQEFYLKDNSLVVYFQPYEYTPYVAGFPEVTISLNSLSDVLGSRITWSED